MKVYPRRADAGCQDPKPILFGNGVHTHEVRSHSQRCEGPGRRLVFLKGMNKKLSYAGMACEDFDGLESLRERVIEERIDISKSNSQYFEPGGFSVIDPDLSLIHI